jgi:hypothetical protein
LGPKETLLHYPKLILVDANKDGSLITLVVSMMVWILSRNEKYKERLFLEVFLSWV